MPGLCSVGNDPSVRSIGVCCAFLISLSCSTFPREFASAHCLSLRFQRNSTNEVGVGCRLPMVKSAHKEPTFQALAGMCEQQFRVWRGLWW